MKLVIMYYSSNMNYPPQVHVLNICSPAGGCILRRWRVFKRLVSLVGGGLICIVILCVPCKYPLLWQWHSVSKTWVPWRLAGYFHYLEMSLYWLCTPTLCISETTWWSLRKKKKENWERERKWGHDSSQATRIQYAATAETNATACAEGHTHTWICAVLFLRVLSLHKCLCLNLGENLFSMNSKLL